METPERFTLVGANGDTPDGSSQRVRSEYVEEAWLPYVGPVALLLARRMDLALSTNQSVGVEVNKWAATLGVGHQDISAALNRLVRYGLAAWQEKSAPSSPLIYTLHRHWPAVPLAIATPPHREALLALTD